MIGCGRSPKKSRPTASFIFILLISNNLHFGSAVDVNKNGDLPHLAAEAVGRVPPVEPEAADQSSGPERR